MGVALYLIGCAGLGVLQGLILGTARVRASTAMLALLGQAVALGVLMLGFHMVTTP